MKRIDALSTASAIALFAALFASTALADENGIPISSLPDKGTVKVTGTVDKVTDARNFTLRDKTGTVDVKLVSDQSKVLRQGDNVTVTGRVENDLFGLLGKDIKATDIEQNKDLPTALSDAVTEHTGISMEKAKTAEIGKLPDKGMVKVTGTVDAVADAKDFTLRDATGSIGVNVQSDESVVLTKGAQVTVVGYVDKGIFGKQFKATRVIVVADATSQSSSTHAE